MGFELKRSPKSQQNKQIHRYMRGGAVPWSAGYKEAKEQFISHTLTSVDLMERFRSVLPLPAGYGVGFDERCVEYPWLLAHLGVSTNSLLDAGSVLNHAFIVDEARFQLRNLHILTLAPENECFWQKGISYVFADLRDTPLRNEYYANIACISTLEHVGCDNSGISGPDYHRESRLDDYAVVMRELHRILKPGGTLYVTVPYGRHRDYGTFQQFDAAMVSRAIAAFGAAKEVETNFFRYTADGWNLAAQAECDGYEFTEWILRLWRGELQPSDVVVDPDRSAAARAVACLRLVKA